MVVSSCVQRHEFIVERPGFFDGSFMLSLDTKRCILQLLLMLQMLFHPHLPATLKHTLVCNIVNHFLEKQTKKTF